MFEHFGFPKLAVDRPIVEIGNYSVINYAGHLWERNLRPLVIEQKGNLRVEFAEHSSKPLSEIFHVQSCFIKNFSYRIFLCLELFSPRVSKAMSCNQKWFFSFFDFHNKLCRKETRFFVWSFFLALKICVHKSP